jgi:hypothetical protein
MIGKWILIFGVVLVGEDKVAGPDSESVPDTLSSPEFEPRQSPDSRLSIVHSPTACRQRSLSQ